MPDEVQGVGADSLPADGTTDSSSDSTPLAQPASEQGTPPSTQPVVAVEPPFHEHPRWKEVQQEKDALREQNRVLAETLQRVVQPAPVAEADPWAGLVNHLDPATAQFYQQQRVLFQHEARRVADQQLQPLQQAVGMGRAQLAQVTLSKFYQDNPDITPQSPEALDIAARVQQGYPLEEAKWIVMGPRYAQQAKTVSQSAQVKSHQAAQKRQLPPDSGSGIPAASGLPARQPSFRETLQQELVKAEREATASP